MPVIDRMEAPTAPMAARKRSNYSVGVREKRQEVKSRVFWPRANDQRRTLVGKSPSNKDARSCTPSSHFVHVSSWDVEVHHKLTAAKFEHRHVGGGVDLILSTNPPALNIPLSWNPHAIKTEDAHLLHYFHHVASHALSTFGLETIDLGGILLRMASADDSAFSTALLKSILAFSSLHRYGPHSQALELKISALAALGADISKSKDLDTKQALQHVTTDMLLYFFEIHQASQTSGDWTQYLCGAEKVIRTTSLNTTHDQDAASVLDWVYYHEVMGRFTLKHWDDQGKGLRIVINPPDTRSEASLATPSAMEMLDLLYRIYDAVSTDQAACRSSTTSTLPVFSAEERENFKILNWKLQNIPTRDAVDETFQLAALLYLDRVVSGALHQPLRTQPRVDHAFAAVLPHLPACGRRCPLFVVFILGAEARTDQQRAVILDLLHPPLPSPSRSEAAAAGDDADAVVVAAAASRQTEHVHLLLEALWAQEDLRDKQYGDLEYRSRLTYTISRCATPPCFA
ncbi:hypothetical protein HD806DRAFT_514283 [Xylariaceae sp. AK1471]|nr:hypothetical protein HD806DRAFT_514283 [Xylariaceae sp. AK1471]